MKIANLQQTISQPLSALKSLGLGGPNLTGSSSAGGGLLETITGAATSVSVPAASQAFTALKNLLKSAGSIGAANTIQNDFTKLATALGGDLTGGVTQKPSSAQQRRPGAYQEQSSLGGVTANSSYNSTVSLVA